MTPPILDGTVSDYGSATEAPWWSIKAGARLPFWLVLIFVAYVGTAAWLGAQS